MASKLGHLDSTSSTFSQLQYHLQSIWLFTRSDLKTIVLPSTIFAVSHGLALLDDNALSLGPRDFLHRTLLALIWTWLNLLPFCIDNQRRPSAIQEDLVNKPWRPLPSQRLLPKQAQALMVLFYTAAVLLSVLVGGLRQSVALIALGYWYNNLQGANKNFLVRNFINGFGFICFSSGALDVLLGGMPQLLLSLGPWFLLIATVVFTTVQTQDMHDQAGDRLQGRKTMPLVIGDSTTRAITAALMTLWSIVVPAVWGAQYCYSLPFIGFGLLVGARSLVLRSVSSDKTSAALWNAWMVGLYLFPLLSGANLHDSLVL